MATVLDALLVDLEAEHLSLDDVVAGCDDAAWSTKTPAAGWDVRDCISHLCFFDEAATTAIADRHRFEVETARLLESKAEGVDLDVELGRAFSPSELLARWRRSRRGYVDAVRGAPDPKARVPWYGPAMSLTSFTTARLMEVWAHGADVRDALGLPIESTDRLRHVCHLGFGARGFSFAAHQVPDPGDPVTVVATDTGWAWGDPDAANRIEGTALDLALVFTQRRHRRRTTVRAIGPVAEQWLSVAQAFAGPATTAAPDR
jgi:uncharacterized protein (TIGR03084 family)